MREIFELIRTERRMISEDEIQHEIERLLHRVHSSKIITLKDVLEPDAFLKILQPFYLFPGSKGTH
jgi:hypothetical protein